MKKFTNKICGVLLLLLLTAGLTACNGENGGMDRNINLPTANQPSDTTATPPTTQTTDPTPQPPTEQTASHQHTLAELSATIEAAGEFWNGWWHRTGIFTWEHIDDSMSNFQPFDENVAPAHHPVSRGFSRLLPSSGFTRFYEIDDYLLQFYTQSWVDRGQFAEPLVSAEFMGEEVQRFGWTNAFEPYDGNLYIFTWNESQPRPDWQTATHTLIEQEGNRAVVETVVQTSFYGFEGGGIMPTITYRFTFIDGRIDSAYGRWHETYSSQDYHVQQGYYARFDDSRLFIYRVEDVNLASFDAILYIYHSWLGASDVQGDDMLIGATRQIYNVSLMQIERVFDDFWDRYGYSSPNEGIFITEFLRAGEGIVIRDFVSMGTLPWSAITFTTAPGERHFFAINHDNSDSPNRFMLLDITGEMLAG